LSSDWRRVSVAELCDQNVLEISTGPFGSQLHAHDYVVSEGVSVVPTEAIRDRRLDHSVLPKVSLSKADDLVRHRLRAGDILFARRGVQATGKIAIIRDHEEGFLCGTGAIRMRVRDRTVVNPEFLSFVFADSAAVAWFKFHAIGATMPNLNEGIIRSFTFTVPPLSVQRRIAEILGALDDKIELNRRMNETLEEIANTMFHRLAAGARARATTPLGAYVNLQRGTTYKSSLKGLPGPYLLGLGSFRRDGGFRSTKLETYGGESPEALLLKPGDIYVSLKDVTQSADLLGAAARVPAWVALGRLTQDTVKLIPKTPDAPMEIIYRTLLSGPYRDYCRAHATGTTNLGLSRDDFLAYPVISAEPHKATVFETTARSLSVRAELAEDESRTLAELRDTLLPKLLSGELRVRDAEAEVATHV